MATIYYIDPTNGSQDNDGLTPSTAFKEFKEGLGDADNHCEFFVRRDSTLVITESKFVEWFSVKRWPTSEDDNYDTRPQDGIDSGWDDDASSRPLIQIGDSKNFYWQSGNADTGVANFYEIDIEFTSTSESILFACYAIQSEFKNVNIKGNQSGMRLYKYYSSGVTTDMNVVWSNVHVDNRSYDDESNGTYHSIVFYAAGNGAVDYRNNVKFTDVTIHGVNNTVYANSSRAGKDFLIELVRCEIETGSHGFLRHGPDQSSRRAVMFVDMNSSSIRSYSGDVIFNISHEASFYSYQLSLIANDSTLHTSSYVIHSRNTYGGWVARNEITELKLSGCNIDALRVVSYDTATDYAYIGKLSVRNCSIKNCSTVFYMGMRHLSGSTDIEFVGNTLDEVVNFIYAPTVDISLKIVSLHGAVLTGYLISGRVVGGRISIVDCSISKHLTTHLTRNISIDVTASSIDSIAGSSVSVSASGSRIQASEEVVSNGASLRATDCHVISDNSSISGIGASALIVTSKVSSASKSIGRLEAFGCEYNGSIFPLLTEDIMTSIFEVMSARDGDTSASKLEFKSDGVEQSWSHSGGSFLYDGSSTTLTVYIIASLGSLFDGSKFMIQLVDGGFLKGVESSSVQDDDGAWSGYDSSVVKKKIVFNIEDYHSVESGSKIKFVSYGVSSPSTGNFIVVDNTVLGA